MPFGLGTVSCGTIFSLQQCLQIAFIFNFFLKKMLIKLYLLPNRTSYCLKFAAVSWDSYFVPIHTHEYSLWNITCPPKLMGLNLRLNLRVKLSLRQAKWSSGSWLPVSPGHFELLSWKCISVKEKLKHNLPLELLQHNLPLLCCSQVATSVSLSLPRTLKIMPS